MDYKEYTPPKDRWINTMILLYAVVCDATVDEAFEFAIHGKKTIDGGRKKPIDDEEIVRMYNNGMYFKDIAKLFGVATSTISRRYKKYVSRETEG